MQIWVTEKYGSLKRSSVRLNLLCVAHPAAVFDSKSNLGRSLARITPDGLSKFFLCLSGSEAVENALKMARLYTGRSKVIARRRGYHGASMGSLVVNRGPTTLLPNRVCGAYCGQRTHTVIDVLMVSRPIRVDFAVRSIWSTSLKWKIRIVSQRL